MYISDETQLQYIRDAINTAFATYGRRRKPMGGQYAGGRTSPDGSPSPLEEQRAVGVASGSSLDKQGAMSASSASSLDKSGAIAGTSSSSLEDYGAVGGSSASSLELQGAVGGACGGGSRPEGGAEGGSSSLSDVAGSLSLDQFQVDTYVRHF